jgi:mannose/cellobiose epimerase-like protein (N-acyl-D-glucosamine 2-epimerase family)
MVAPTAPTVSAPAGEGGLRWLIAHAWPLWLEWGVDWRRRAFHEHLDPVSLKCGAEFRRLRVAARQTYVFATAARFGVPRAAEAAELGLAFLQGPARLADGGYAWRFDLASRPIDLMRDLYDHAFVLLAYAAAVEVVGADRLRADAVALVDYLATHFAHPAGGYRESLTGALPRRQNPHMHLFEAMLAAGGAFGDAIFFRQAEELADLMVGRLFQARAGALPEYFDDPLEPVMEAGRFAVEPGHHYEWTWLLDWYRTCAGRGGVPVRADLTAIADSLFEFAERWGVSPAHGLVVNGLWSDGAVADAGFRLWPQTERLKAVARRRAGPDGFAKAAAGLDRHLAAAPPGLWIERMNPDGQAIIEAVPATSLYHLTAALTDDAVVQRGGPEAGGSGTAAGRDGAG